jgi:hypothetical protein
MIVVVLGARPERHDVSEREREVVAAVRRDRLTQLRRDRARVSCEVLVLGSLKTIREARTLSVTQMSIVSRWRLCVSAAKTIGPPIVPDPSRRTSSGWAYSAVRPNGAGYSWCTLWIHLAR